MAKTKLNVRSETSVKDLIARLVKRSPDAVLEAILKYPFWPKDLDPKLSYTRFADDQKGSVTVMFHPAVSDVWVEVISEVDRDEGSTSLRFCVELIGGGKSERTRRALVFLARAIAMDNADSPQR